MAGPGKWVDFGLAAMTVPLSLPEEEEEEEGPPELAIFPYCECCVGAGRDKACSWAAGRRLGPEAGSQEHRAELRHEC